MAAITKGRLSAATIYTILSLEPTIIQDDNSKEFPESIEGHIEFKNVKFNYPTRPNVRVLNGLSLKIQKGTKVALVGATGCGKSTIIQLIERFYDPLEGEVFVDGKNIKEYN